ncbi:MAG: hypothetical protein Greene041662_369 [Candidatus Peregrinibacteria bacterium Greene0416_62]|nr:MAG: hypothetical protein Greene041662_369 [Candidatus Peregrinibacteria bacterium Greene0416_62]TSC99130.1 MAG: hypothetical protein Greene101449_706 [Candidatus Peregrinibacteria bacterium Greene1014_49]
MSPLDPQEISPNELFEYIGELQAALKLERDNFCATASLALKKKLQVTAKLFEEWISDVPAYTFHEQIFESPKYAKHRNMGPKRLMRRLQKLDEDRTALRQEEAVICRLIGDWAKRISRHL